MSPEILSALVKKTAQELGFLDCGIAKASFLEEEAPRLEQWLNRSYQGKMSYLENYFDVRLDPSKLVEGAKTVIVLLSNYYPETKIDTDQNYKIAKYAYGRDYHKVLRKKLKSILSVIQENQGQVAGRVFVDSAPILEREWAKRAGIGWIGKNTLLLSKKKGSFFFLSEIVLDVEMQYDHPVADHCGSCTACLDSCPPNDFPTLCTRCE